MANADLRTPGALRIRIAWIAALAGSALLFAAVAADAFLNYRESGLQAAVFAACGAPLCLLLFFSVLRHPALETVHCLLLPLLLPFLMLGRLAAIAAVVPLAALLLPLGPRPALPLREMPPKRPWYHWLASFLIVLLLHNFDLPLSLLGIDWTLSDRLYVAFDYLYPLAILLLGTALLGGYLQRDFAALRENGERYARRALPWLALGVLCSLGVTALLASAPLPETPVNEQLAAQDSTVTAIFSGAILSAAAEVLLYCGLLRRVLRNKYVFIAVSSLLFGAVHVLFEPNLASFLLNGAAYAALGFAFSAAYAETDNLFVPVFAYSLLELLTVLGGLPFLQNL